MRFAQTETPSRESSVQTPNDAFERTDRSVLLFSGEHRWRPAAQRKR
jgi:hypothetical protein